MYKQCFIKLVESGTFTTIWVAIKDAIKNKKIKVNYPMFNIKGEAIILNVYNNITLK